jgi:VIT1/CCC1 family predicted Fe2+/Mn2+ transporter
MVIRPKEKHRTQHIGWLRAAVLGANDGIVSTASLIVGVAAAQATRSDVLVAGVAGLVAGAMSMAAGEYVSVSSQSDTEQADLERERQELAADGQFEQDELAAIYITRGLEPGLAKQVAEQLMTKDALATHARDELGISEMVTARPIQAALTSAATFAVGAALPLLTVVIAAMTTNIIPFVIGTSLVSLAILGALAAYTGGAPIVSGAWRVTFWGALAMGLTAGVGTLFGAVV